MSRTLIRAMCRSRICRTGPERYPARDIVGGGFLGLVRYGIRRSGDEHILKTLAVYDHVLKVDTPYGPGWHRYNHDGYGQKANGDPFERRCRAALATADRRARSLRACRRASPYAYIKAMEGFASSCCLIPEQVWDTTDIPDKHMLMGRPTGSALPLVWAHAEYIKLVRSERDAAIFDLIAPVHKRYIDDCVTTDCRYGHSSRVCLNSTPDAPCVSKFMRQRACAGPQTTG